MIEKYIVELLETNNRVIVPDFGAFMVKIENGKRIITFNDFLKYNDGLLNNHIATKESISKEDALKKVKDQVKIFQEDLKANKSINFETIGELKKDERGGIHIVSKDLPTPTPSVQPIPIIEKSEIKTEIKTEETNKIEDTSMNVNPNQPKPINQEPPKPAEPVQPKPVQPTPPVGQKQPLPNPNPNPNPASKPPVKQGTPLPPPVKKTNQPKKSKTTLIIIIIAILVVLGSAGVILYLNCEQWFDCCKPPVIEEPVIVEPEPVIIEEPPVVVETPKYPPGTPKYYVVAGCFEIKSNAERLVEVLRKQGYNSEIFSERGGFYRVCYNSYYNSAEAFAEMNRLVRELDPDIWVQKK